MKAVLLLVAGVLSVGLASAPPSSTSVDSLQASALKAFAEPPMATKIVEPVVSDSLLAAATDTVVLVQIALDESGKVTGTIPVRGDTLLFPAAEQAVLLWEFTPAIMDTAPVAVRIVVPVRFYPSRSN